MCAGKPAACTTSIRTSSIKRERDFSSAAGLGRSRYCACNKARCSLSFLRQLAGLSAGVGAAPSGMRQPGGGFVRHAGRNGEDFIAGIGDQYGVFPLRG